MEVEKQEFKKEKEYNPEYDAEKYLKILCDLFAEQEKRRKIDELKNTIEIKEMPYKESLGYEEKIQKLEEQLLSDDNYEKLVIESDLRLQKDIAILRKDNRDTIEEVLKSPKGNKLKELIKDCRETEWKILEINNIKEKIKEFLENFLCEVAKNNNWEIGFDKKEITPELRQRIYISDGNKTVVIKLSLLDFEDKSVKKWLDGEEKFGLNDIRRYIDLRLGKKLNRISHNSAPIIVSSEDGWPDIRRLPTPEEIAFLEKVIAAYY